MLAEHIAKMDCDRCKLRTEHYVLDYGGKPALTRCLRCGHVTATTGVPVDHEPYPTDDRKPIYVV